MGWNDCAHSCPGFPSSILVVTWLPVSQILLFGKTCWSLWWCFPSQKSWCSDHGLRCGLEGSALAGWTGFLGVQGASNHVSVLHWVLRAEQPPAGRLAGLYLAATRTQLHTPPCNCPRTGKWCAGGVESFVATPAFASWLCHFIVTWPWTYYLSLLDLSFLTCELRRPPPF